VPYLTFNIRVTSDVGGQPAIIFEYAARLFLTEAQLLALQKAGGDGAGVYTEIPTVNEIPALNAFILTSDQPINLKFASVSAADGVIALKNNSLVAIINGNIAAGANLNATINNTGANPANLGGVAGGT